MHTLALPKFDHPGLPIRVYYEDTDAGGVVYYANYLRFIERGRTEWLRALGYDQGRLAADLGVVFAVRSLSAEYLKPTRLDDQLTVFTAIESHSRAAIVFVQHVERDGERLFEATVKVACLDRESFKPVAIPPAILERIRNPS
ncbi:tol-pal system-associated acyl-CoA thioesterase [Denitratisoma oestradiolicum]|uniref:Acyl-CoA thioesterase n=1 Tax=Denitratisoma oestradiolicum TaxID=311182 RepID=A0A6S6Y5B3_9PROT|nr:tol-pal system-associated acyl-CoA thioesterase [Denitratisoma oestradiolicum]TWO81637.1 tol-pal system-associated acyl-CoA thioesterase [Denitratisoma oestradiolicum]CAB1370580.1 acyl-CoA thioesterase [Denitratisoma oestradiolicum]